MTPENITNLNDSYEEIKQDVIKITGNHLDFENLRNSKYPQDVLMLITRALNLAEKEPKGFFGKRKSELLALEKRAQEVTNQQIQQQIDEKNESTQLENQKLDVKENTKEEEIKGIAEILGSKEAINYYKNKEQKEKEREVKIKELRETIENAQKVIEENEKVIRENEIQNKSIFEKLAKLYRKPEEVKNKEEIESFDTKFIEDTISKLLNQVKEIKNIKVIKISGHGDELVLYANVTAGKFLIPVDIDVNGISIVNNGNSIEPEKNYLSKISATRGENMVKDVIAENMSSLETRIIEFISKDKNKSVEKIWIEDGQLKVLYKK
ncbi:MAG: hypothetical protein AAB913_01275 [Patescibacteria group bacterium]